MKDLKTSLPPSLHKTFKFVWPVLLIVLVVGLFFWKFIFRGSVPIPGDFVVGTYYPWLDYQWEGFPTGVPVKNPITTDVVSFIYPMQKLAIDLLRRGELPLWNPYILAGAPLLANFQSAPFSPTNFVYFLVNNHDTAWGLQIMLQHIMVALFTFFLMRGWGISKFSSVFAGIIFAFSGYNLIWSQWNGHTLTAAFIPLTILFTDRLLKAPKWYFAAGLSISIFFQVISGYPQTLFYTAIAMIVLWLVHLKKEKSFIIKTVIISVFALLGLGMSLFQILPGAELLSLSQREVEPLEFSWAFLPLQKLITFIAPDYFGNHATQNYWGPQDYTTTTGYVGVIALTMALYGAITRVKEKEVKYGLFLLAVSLLFALPFPLSVALWRAGIFGLQAASFHRSLILFTFSVSILASFGLDHLRSRTAITSALKALLMPAIMLALFGGYALTNYKLQVFDGVSAQDSYVALRNLFYPTVFFAGITISFLLLRFGKFKKIVPSLVFVLMILELFRFGWKFTPFTPRHLIFPETPELEYLLDQEKPFRVTANNTIPINIRMTYGLESLEGYDAIYPLNIAKFIAVLNSLKPDASPQGRYASVSNESSPLLGLVNTRYVMTLRRENNRPSINGKLDEQFLDASRYKQIINERVTEVLEDTKAMPRSFLAEDYVVLERSEVLKRMVSDSFDPKTIILEKDPGLEVSTPVGEVSYSEYSENESVIKVELENESLLFTSDLYYPGWRSYVDGQEVEILRANYAFRAIVVPSGEHEVRFTYQPDSFRNGIRLSALSFAGLIASSFATGRIVNNYKLNYNKVHS